MNNKILVVDDEEDIRSLVARILNEQRGYEVLQAQTASEVIEMISVHDVSVILADMRMPEMNGLELLGRIKDKWPDKTVIIMTAYGSIENAVEAMKRGAYDYLTKPFQHDDLVLVIERAFERVRLLDDRRYFQSELQRCFGFSELIGHSRGMLKIYETIRNVSVTTVPVLIAGESGTGKELVARAIHFESKRRERRFVAINCAALPETILESELFGHVRGAFTGAIRDKKGLLEEADGGTLFLDEVGDISPQIQAKLLRILQDGEFRSIGDLKVRRVDFRTISATNKNIDDEVAKGRFREDLYYRLKVITIKMPPLRERTEDIPLLADHFMKKYSKKYGKNVTGISDSAMRRLVNNPWKGNVRELENAIARAVAVLNDTVIDESDLFSEECSIISHANFKAAKKKALLDFYRTFITSALIRNNGNITKTAEECGMMRQSLQQLMKRCSINPGDFR